MIVMTSRHARAIALLLSSASSATIQMENEFEMHEIQNEFLLCEPVKKWQIANLEICCSILTEPLKNYRSMVLNNKFVVF